LIGKLEGKIALVTAASSSMRDQIVRAATEFE
jgi:hypothetical protein